MLISHNELWTHLVEGYHLLVVQVFLFIGSYPVGRFKKDKDTRESAVHDERVTQKWNVSSSSIYKKKLSVVTGRFKGDAAKMASCVTLVEIPTEAPTQNFHLYFFRPQGRKRSVYRWWSSIKPPTTTLYTQKKDFLPSNKLNWLSFLTKKRPLGISNVFFI